MSALHTFLNQLAERNPNQPEFLQAAHEILEDVFPFVESQPKYKNHALLERFTEPERVISFRVCWEDDKGNIQVNRGWRVQFNSAIGPYKGGLRFHPTVNESILKFLGLEQTLKNALTTLPMGGGKGGSNFNPSGKSDREIQRFCQAFMTELYRHIGEDTDVPAGDIGVGAREIGFLFGQYRRIANRFTPVLTGKGIPYGGSLIRKEATGYGAVYFAENMLNHRGDSVKGKKAIISGSGNVSLYCAQKLIALGATPVTMSDSGGFIHDPEGICTEKLQWLIDLKENRRGRISEYVDKFPKATFTPNATPWGVAAELAFPCATQNELNLEDAKTLTQNGLICLAEGANMPSTLEAMHHFIENNVLFGPAKAANAGGVSVSGLEQSQNSIRLSWNAEEVEEKLKGIMLNIHNTCVKHGAEGTRVNYVKGANLAGFAKVADALIAQGLI